MLPKWREKFSPDIVVANVENIAHGKGIGLKQIEELREAGVQIFTGGNHSVEGKDSAKILSDKTIPITRPANMSPNFPGRGVVLYKVKSQNETSPSSTLGVELPQTPSVFPVEAELLVINLIGQVNMRQNYDSPFHAVDKILENFSDATPFKIVDWHADITSEKEVMGWYLDGKVSAVFGTHTHVPTADAKILPRGTAYISDVGMVGPYNSIIGVEIEPAFSRFKNQASSPLNIVETGPIEVNAIYLEISESGQAVDIKHLREIIIEYSI